MPKLSKEQEQAVKQWAEDGSNLNEIQDRLKREHDITLTYLDARMLVIELGLKLQEKKRDSAPEEKKEPAPSLPNAPAATDEVADAELMAPEPPVAGGNVKIVIDQIAIPGKVVSGKVTFSDGKTAGWYVDQMGRLGMNAPEPGYKPPPADVPVFQRDLDLALQRAGF
jgi:hypothetical protein